MARPQSKKVSPASSDLSKLTIFSLAQARAIVLRSQGLADNPSPFGTGKKAVLATIQHLGYVQVDSVNVIQRAHHHVLWSRVPDYSPDMLHELQSPDGAVFEYWNHAASFMATRDYRFSIPLMRKFKAELHWSDESPELKASLKRMRGLISKKGPLMISDVESTAKVPGWSATSFGKIERRALHELWMRGDIMIRSRNGFQKVFDLPNRVLPAHTEMNFPTKREAGEFHVRRALRALGVARAQEINSYQESADSTAVREALLNLKKSGEVLEYSIAEIPDAAVFVLRESMNLAKPLETNLLRFLSPFDNLTIQRKRLKWLFDFDYTIEIYIPAAKRKYGYFSLPILWGDRLIGRLDAKANRPARQLVVNNLVFEPTFSDLDAIQKPFLKALGDFTRFQQCDEWEISRVEPKQFKNSLS